MSEFSTFFSSVFTKEDTENLPTAPHEGSQTLEEVEITLEKVKNKLVKLSNSKAPGPDGIHPRILREAAEEVSVPLLLLFQKTMDTGELPEDWKRANITPIYKSKGSKESVKNYRPISLTSQVCKIFESIIRDEMIDFFVESDSLLDPQHGFVPGRSCTSQLILVIEEWSRNLDAGTPVDAIYLDFRKAFDAVAHETTCHPIWTRYQGQTTKLDKKLPHRMKAESCTQRFTI